MMLTVEHIECAYGEARVLHDVSLTLAPSQVLCLLGRNGAGKTTTLRAIMGLTRPRAGTIRVDGRELTRLPAYEIPRLGIGYVPQGRGLFPFLTVGENLKMGLLVKGAGPETLQSVFATARALCANPTYLLMDEPTEGLMPILVQRLMATVMTLKTRGVGVLLVEQRIDAALRVADQVVVLETGHVRYAGPPAGLAQDSETLLRYLGIRHTNEGRHRS